LIGDPSIILADEPTGNLDLESAREVLSLLRAQAQDGRTVLVVSHNRLVADLSDRELDLTRLSSVEVSR
jgi:ABC-type lipoprotein export system ATPase subunit